MNCQNFESIVNDLARNQMMEAGAREQAQLHSSSCDLCAARLREEEALTLALRELTVSMRDESASFEIESRLAVAFRERHAVSNGVANASTTFASVGVARSSRRYWSYAAAAVVLLAVALGLAANRLWRVEVSPAPGQVAESNGSSSPANPKALEKVSPSAHPVAEGLLVPEGVTIKPDSRAPRSRSSKYVSAARSRMDKIGNTVTVQSLNILAPAPEVTTGFIPIGYLNAANVQEGGQVVRLEMPRYAMARFGVPINEERYAEMVKADVWVGADGLARAIRFVQ